VIGGSLLAIGAVGFGTFNLIDLMAHEERTERFTVPAAEVGRVLVDNDRGSVTIVGTATDTITVEAEVSDGLRATEFDHEVIGSTLQLRGSCASIGANWCRVTWRIEVPRDLDLEVDADNDRVNISDVDGDIVVDSDNGAVELADIAGSVEVDADNGRIVGTDLTGRSVVAGSNNSRVELTFTEVPDLVRATSDNGSIEITVPPVNGGYNVTADTDNGDLDLSTVNDNPESPRIIDVETNNGDITVRTML
jgi:hypothetical protein